MNANDPLHWNAEAESFVAQGQLGRAFEAIQRALALDPKCEPAINTYWRVKALLVASAPEAAAAPDAERPASPLIPEPGAVAGEAAELASKGEALLSQGRFHDALTAFDDALKLDPGSVPALGGRGNALFGLGRHAEALAAYEQVIAFDPARRLPALSGKGNALNALGRPAEALTAYEEALALDRNFLPALNGKGSALNDLGRHAEALALYDRALALNPRWIPAVGGRGNALLGLGRHAEALAAYEQVIALDPTRRLPALSGKGNALNALGQPAEALIAYEEALALDPNFLPALSGKGSALNDLGRHAEALALYDQALGLNPRWISAAGGRGNALSRLGRYGEALAAYEQALALNPRLFSALNGKGNALNKLGRQAEALTTFDRALGSYPTHPVVWIGKGNALRDLGRHGEALAAYEQALRLKPDYAAAHQAIALLFVYTQPHPPLSGHLAKSHFFRALYLNYICPRSAAHSLSEDLPCLPLFCPGPLLQRRLLLTTSHTADSLTYFTLWEEVLPGCDTPDYLCHLLDQNAEPAPQHQRLLHQALVHYHFGDPFAAADVLRQSLTLNPRSPQAHYYLITSLHSFLEPCAAEKQAALPLANDLLSSPAPASPLDLYYAGQILLLNGATASALQAFTRSSSLLPSRYMAWYCFDDSAPEKHAHIEAAFAEESRLLLEGKTAGFLGPIPIQRIGAGCLDQSLATLQHLRQRAEIAPALLAALSRPDIREKAPAILRLLPPGVGSSISHVLTQEQPHPWELNDSARADLERARLDDRESRAATLHADLAEYLKTIPDLRLAPPPGEPGLDEQLGGNIQRQSAIAASAPTLRDLNLYCFLKRHLSAEHFFILSAYLDLKLKLQPPAAPPQPLALAAAAAQAAAIVEAPAVVRAELSLAVATLYVLYQIKSGDLPAYSSFKEDFYTHYTDADKHATHTSPQQSTFAS